MPVPFLRPLFLERSFVTEIGRGIQNENTLEHDREVFLLAAYVRRKQRKCLA
jgi:hypothetical protein